MPSLNENYSTIPSEVEWLAEQGCRVFPLRPKMKTPVFEGWRESHQ